MANWASTDYVIEGPSETLLKIKEAIQHPIKSADASDGYEGDILDTLGIKWKRRQPDGSGHYMRGFIEDVECIEFNPETDTTLSFYAEEAWGATDFHEVLEKGLPNIKVYFCVVEEGGEIYATNDKEGKYFPYRWHVEACFGGNYEYEEFFDEKSMCEWLSAETNGTVKSIQDANNYSSAYEESGDEDENYIWIHKYEVVD